AAHCPAMFAKRLQRPERPAETLPEQRRETVGRFGVADGVAVRFDAPARAADSPRQIHIFGHRVGRVAAGLYHGFATPRADRSRHHADRVDHRVCTAIEILAGDIFDRLPVREWIDSIPDFHI